VASISTSTQQIGNSMQRRLNRHALTAGRIEWQAILRLKGQPVFVPVLKIVVEKRWQIMVETGQLEPHGGKRIPRLLIVEIPPNSHEFEKNQANID
jgi:hypothetical protein